MGPIEQLVDERLSPERAAAVREFAKAYLRRLAAAADEDGHDAEALYHEVLGAFELAASRNGAPIAVRARIDQMIEVARAGAARYEDDEVKEAVAFLQWLARENFILLGARDYEVRDGALQVVAGSGLGLLDDESRSAFAKPVPVESLDPNLRKRALGGDLLLVSKTNRLSPVHRRARMDYIGIKRVGPGGDIVGESRMLGLFTTKAYAEPASDSPLLHRKLQRILASEDLIEGSHDYKAAVSLFDSFPKDELIGAPTEDLRRAVVALLGLHPDQGRVLGRLDADGRSAAVIVALPKGRYDATLLDRLRAFLSERFGVATVDAHEVLAEED